MRVTAVDAANALKQEAQSHEANVRVDILCARRRDELAVDDVFVHGAERVLLLGEPELRLRQRQKSARVRQEMRDGHVLLAFGAEFGDVVGNRCVEVAMAGCQRQTVGDLTLTDPRFRRRSR
jgi:hypothetical protein